jgi:hypothetical protein
MDGQKKTANIYIGLKNLRLILWKCIVLERLDIFLAIFSEN